MCPKILREPGTGEAFKAEIFSYCRTVDVEGSRKGFAKVGRPIIPMPRRRGLDSCLGTLVNLIVMNDFNSPPTGPISKVTVKAFPVKFE